MARVEVYRQWLMDKGKDPAYIDRFINQVTVRHDGTDSASQPQKAGAAQNCLEWATYTLHLCPSDLTLLDLSPGELYGIWAHRKDLPNPTMGTYLTTCLQFVAEQRAPAVDAPGPLNFSLLVRKLGVTEAGEPLLRALLLDDAFVFGNIRQRRELKPETDEYTVCRAVILDNLEKRLEEVAARLIFHIHPILEQRNPYGIHRDFLLAEIRDSYAQLAEQLQKALNDHPGFSGSAEEQLLLQMNGWRTSFSEDRKRERADLDWYEPLGKEALETHLACTFLQLVRLSLRHEGDTFSVPGPAEGLTGTDILYYTLLSPFDRLITLRLVKDESVTTRHIARLLQLGLAWVERMPDQRISCLRLAPAALQTMTGDPTLFPDDPNVLEGVWQDSQLIAILLRLLDTLEESPEYLRLSGENVFAKGPELIALLAAAPPESADSPEQTEDLPALTGALSTLLEGLGSSISLSESTLLELRRALAAVQQKAQVTDAVEKLTALLVKCHWGIIRSTNDHRSAESLQRLIDLYRFRPNAVTKALASLLDDGSGDWQYRSRIISGESLILAELYGRSAADCLALSENEKFSGTVRVSWASRARSDARTAAQMALRLGDGLRAFDARLLQAKALGRMSVLAAEAGTGADSLFTDGISPCAKAVLECEAILKKTLPEQGVGLQGENRTAFENHCQLRGRQLEEAREALRGQLFSPPVAAVLRTHAALWTAIPHDCLSGKDWEALADTRLSTPADKAANSAPSAAVIVPTIWIPASRTAKVFLPYYCSYLDSETTKRRQYQPDRIEAYLLKTILSMENVVLTTNQAVDNPIIRALAYQPGFRQMLRTGHIRVSFFWGYYSLLRYAADKLAAPGFIWSSMPHEFNADMGVRVIASRYLNGKCTARDLPQAYRELIIRFREELTLLDENLPASSKAQAYQYPNSGRKAANLAEKLDGFYLPRQGDPGLDDLCRLHFLLVSPQADPEARKKLIRGQYQTCLDALKNGNLSFLDSMKGLCDPGLYQPGSRQRQILESYMDPGKAGTLALMQSVLSNCQNEMLGALCSDYQHHIYSESERIILPYDETNPINQGSRRLFQDTLTMSETGVRFGWEQAPEFMERSEAILLERPDISPDDLAGRLAGNQLDYTVSADGKALWLARGTVHTSQRHSLLVESCPHTGTIHLQTEEK